MEDMEKNVFNSFRLAKNDIIKLQDKYLDLKKKQAAILERLSKLEAIKTRYPKPIRIVQQVKKPVAHKRSVNKIYIASKEGKKFHLDNCPYAQNIKPKTKIKFKTKSKALNLGYKPCSCIK